MTTRSRFLTALVIALAALTVLLPASAATAATPSGTPLTASWYIQGGTITGPGTAPRHLSSEHAAGFIQSWYLATIYGTLPVSAAPAKSLPVFTVTINDNINGSPYTFVAFYVSDGKKAWVGMPPQTIGPGALVPKKVWFVAPPRATLAFEGKVGLSTDSVPATTTPATPAPKPASSGGSTEWVIAVIGVVLVLGVGGWLVTRGRSAQRSAKPAR